MLRVDSLVLLKAVELAELIIDAVVVVIIVFHGAKQWKSLSREVPKGQQKILVRIHGNVLV
jgi:hypothetical protein